MKILHFLLILFVFAGKASAEIISWKWINPPTGGNSVTSAWIDERGVIYSVAEAGNIFMFNEGKWSPAPVRPEYWVSDIWGVSSSDIFVSGYQGLILQFNGSEWTKIDTGVTNDLNGIWGTSAEDVYAVGDRGTILYFDGSRWEKANLNGWDLLFDIWGSGKDNIFAVGGRGAVLKFNGVVWERQPIPKPLHFVGVWGTDANNVYVYGDMGGIYNYDGIKWTDISISIEEEAVLIRGIMTDEKDTLLAIDENGRIFARKNDKWMFTRMVPNDNGGRILGAYPEGRLIYGDDGKIYVLEKEKIKSLIPDNINNDFYKISSQNLIAADNAVIKYQDGKFIKISTEQKLTSIWETAKGETFAAGEKGTLLSVTDFSAGKIKNIDTGFQNDINSLWGEGENLYGAGSEGLFFSFDGKSIRKEILDGKETTFYAIDGDSPKNIFMAGTSGRILRFDGEKWNSEKTGVIKTIYALSVYRGEVLAAGDNGLILKRVKNSWHRVDISTTSAFFDIAPYGDEGYYVAGARGTLYYLPANERLRNITLPTFKDIYGISVDYSKNRIILTGEGGTMISGEIAK